MITTDFLGLAGRVAVVTGAASGYGRASSQLLAQVGASVVLCDIDAGGLEETFAALPEQDKHAKQVCDIAQVSTCEEIVDTTLERFGRLDILVNVAAVLKRVELEQVDDDLWNHTLNVNLKSQFFLSRAASRPMKEARWGRIINFTSTAGVTGGSPTVSVYGISKAGIIVMTKSFARLLAPYNVLVNSISPATLNTSVFRGGLSQEELGEIGIIGPSQNLLGRAAEAKEVAMTVVYLASKMATCVTGNMLSADCGASASHI